MDTVETPALRAQTSEGGAAWTRESVLALFEQPFGDLLFRAQQVHRAHHDPNAVQRSTLLSIKTGGCPEDCGYCPQSARFGTGVDNEPLLSVDAVLEAARAAREAGLDYYNHNLDTAPEFYGEVITTRTQQDRLDTLAGVREAGLSVCCGGIVGMGESRGQRAGLIATLASLDPYPESVPINNLVRVEGTPLADQAALDPFEFVRTIAAARITMPRAKVRLSAGREAMSDELQALCFLAGANSIFYGERLLTTGNPEAERDRALFERLGLHGEGTA